MVFSFHKKNTKPTVAVALRFCVHRYLRLLPTVAISVMLAYVVIRFGWNANLQVYEIRPMEFLLGAFPTENVSFLNAVYEAFIGTFLHTTSYVAPMWTIPFEFLGICAGYIVYCCLYNQKWRHIAFLALFVVLFVYKIHMSKIVLGIIIGDILFNSNLCLLQIDFECLKNKRIQEVTLILGIMFSATVLLVYQSSLMEIGGITFIILAFLYTQNKVKSVLESSLVLRIAKYSFMVYAIHWVLIFSVGCQLLVVFYKISGSYYVAAGIMSFVMLVITWGISIVIQQIFERFRRVKW